MEYLAKIIHEQRTGNKNLWKYTFLDVEANKEEFFYNNYRVNYLPSIEGKLSLIESDEHPKFFQSFEQDIISADKEICQPEISNQLRRSWEKGVQKAENKLAKKKIKLIERAKYLASLRSRKILSQKELAIAHRRSTRTIRRWEKGEFSYQKTGRKQKMISYDLLLLIHHVFNYPIVTQQERSDYIFEKSGRRYSQQVISLTLKRFGFSRKVVPYSYSKQKKLMVEFWKFVNEIVPKLPQHRLLSLDESNFPLNLALRYGYALRGRKVKAYKPGWATNYSLISLIHNTDKKGVIHWELVEGAVDTEIFYNFLVNVKLPTNEKYYLLLDNIRFHKSAKIKELLKQKNIEPVYIVPYFPQLNPAEEFFNTVKQYVKKHKPRIEESLRIVLAEKMNMLQEERMAKYFSNCLNLKID